MSRSLEVFGPGAEGSPRVGLDKAPMIDLLQGMGRERSRLWISRV